MRLSYTEEYDMPVVVRFTFGELRDLRAALEAAENLDGGGKTERLVREIKRLEADAKASAVSCLGGRMEDRD